MPSRELVYRIAIDTATGKREARNIRATFERELRQISLGKLDTRQLQAGVQQARQLRTELEQVANAGNRAAEQIGQIQVPSIGQAVSGALDSLKLPPALIGGGLVAGGLAVALAAPIADMAKLGTESIRTTKAFEVLSGGATQAQKNINAIQDASGGTIASFQAMQIGNQALALGLASTASEFGRLTQAARAVAFVSPVINDIQSAISELGLASANLSYRRLDQLGLSVQEVRDAMNKLRRENGSLSESQAFLDASVSTLLAKYGDIINSEEARATALERISAAVQDIKTQAAEDITITVNYILNPVADLFDQAATEDKAVQTFLDNQRKAYDIDDNGIKDADAAEQAYADSIRETMRLREQGLISIAEYRFRIDSLVTGLQEYQAAIKETADAEQKAENDRLASVFEAQPAIQSALASQAQEAAGTIGIENAINLYRQQKEQIEGLLQELADTGVSDTNEIAIRVAAITEQLIAPFEELKDQAASVDFSAFSSALSGFDVGFVDFLPGIAEAREELAQLSEEIMFAGTMTAEQAAQFEYLSSVAYAVADGSSQLNAVVNELGGEFLASNAYAAELVNQLFLAEAAYRNNTISADVYAGITAILSGQLLGLAQTAGIATGAIYALNQAQSDMASAGGLAVGGSIANRIQTTQATQAREHNRREQERYAKEQERAAKAAAKHQESAARNAAKELERGAKKAAKELEDGLRKIPGLFSTTDVTEQDMKDAELGIYADKVDEYLRRLRDEVENSVDWMNVSVGEAAAGLQRIGVDTEGLSDEAIVELFERAWNNQSLWSAAENIGIFVNEAAIKEQQALQEKMAEGERNLLEHLGVRVDEAVDVATSGGGSSYTPPEIEPPQYVDVDPLTEGLQTGLDDYMERSGETVKQALQNAESAFFDPASLFGTGAKTGSKTRTFGPMPKEITITADPSAQALTPYLAATAPGATPTAPLPATIAPTIDATAFQAEIDKLALSAAVTLYTTIEEIQLYKGIIEVGVKPKIATSLTIAEDKIAAYKIAIASAVTPSVATQLHTTIEEIQLYKDTVAATVKPIIEPHLSASPTTMSEFTFYLESNVPAPSIGTRLHTDIEEIQLFEDMVEASIKPTVTVDLQLAEPAEGSESANAIAPLITNLNTQIRGETEGIKREGATVAQILMAGIIAHFQATKDAQGQQITTIADNLLANVGGQLQTMQGTFYAQGVSPAQAILSGMEATLKGGQAAMGGGAGEGGIGELASALLTNAASQFSMTQNMFYAVGFLPAQGVQDGFKNYEYAGLADSFMEKLTTNIRENGENLKQRGGTMASYVQSGFVTAFNSEAFKAQLIAIGELMYGYLEIGILARVNGGALTNAIASKVVEDLATELEQP